MNKDDLIIKIASILLKRDCQNWTWELANPILKAKYSKEATAIYQLLCKEGIINISVVQKSAK